MHVLVIPIHEDLRRAALVDVRDCRGVPGHGDGIGPQEGARTAVDRDDVLRVAADEGVQCAVAVHIDEGRSREEDAGAVVRPNDRAGVVEADHARRVRRYHDAEFAATVHVRDLRGEGHALPGGDEGPPLQVPVIVEAVHVSVRPAEHRVEPAVVVQVRDRRPGGAAARRAVRPEGTRAPCARPIRRQGRTVRAVHDVVRLGSVRPDRRAKEHMRARDLSAAVRVSVHLGRHLPARIVHAEVPRGVPDRVRRERHHDVDRLKRSVYARRLADRDRQDRPRMASVALRPRGEPGDDPDLAAGTSHLV